MKCSECGIGLEGIERAGEFIIFTCPICKLSIFVKVGGTNETNNN